MNYKTCFVSIIAVTLLAFHGNNRAMNKMVVQGIKADVLIPLGVTGGMLFTQYVLGKTFGSKEKRSLYERVKQCEGEIEKWHTEYGPLLDAITYTYSPKNKRGSFQVDSDVANKFVQALNYLEELRRPNDGQMEILEKLVSEQSGKLSILLNFLYDKKIPEKLREHDVYGNRIAELEKEVEKLKQECKTIIPSFKSELAELAKNFRVEVALLDNELKELKKELGWRKTRESDNESGE